MPRKYFENLDGLRFLLAMVVFFGHSGFGGALQKVIPVNFLDRVIGVFSTGSLGVSFFFTLSGYLITYLIVEEKEETGNFHLGKFYLRRVLRIWPLYYVVLVFSFFIYPWVKVQLGYADQNPYNFLYHLFFLSNFDSISIHENGLVEVAPMMIDINWSIAIEEQFYLFWPLLFLLVGARKFWMVILSVIIISWYFRTFYFEGVELYYHTLSVISDLGVGALLAYLTFYNKDFVKSITNMSRFSIIVVYVLGLLFLMYAEVLSTLNLPNRILRATFFSFIIIEQNFSERSFYKFSQITFLTSLGKYTYALYLLHPIGIQVSIVLFRLLGLDAKSGFIYALLYAAIAFTASMTMSLLSYRYIEAFFLGLRSRFRPGREPVSI